MKSLFILIVFILLNQTSFAKGLNNSFTSEDEEELKQKLSLISGQNNSGKDFWFAIPPCYEEESAGYDNFIKIYVISPFKTKVNVDVSGVDYYKEKIIEPNKVVDFELKPAEAQPFTHNGRVNPAPPAQVYEGRGIHVYSESPIVVYVVVRYNHTSDGFLAIPSNSLGTHYINMVYQEPDITPGHMAPFTMVTTPYDNTNITFTMGGGPEGNDAVPLANGRKLETGDTAQQMMHRGDVWALSIDDHAQDLSGSIIKGDKPFSIVSGVHCANFPLGTYACDYTVEMETPVNTWGTHYNVVPMKDRDFNGIIRVFAKEDSTKIYRNDTYFGTIKKGGGADFGVGYLEHRLWPMYVNGEPNPPKHATIHADKPIQVMYYNTGATEDNKVTDPFMLLNTPVDQYQNKIYFTTPNVKGDASQYPLNYVNIVFELENNKIPEDLLFAEIEGDNINWKKLSSEFDDTFSKFEMEIDGKSYASKQLELPNEGVFGIKSQNHKFTASSYGFSNWDSYGYPTSTVTKTTNSQDTKIPKINYTESNGGKNVNGEIDDSGFISEGISQFYMIESESENFIFNINSVDKGEVTDEDGELSFIPGTPTNINWELNKNDSLKDALAVMYVSDKAGNDSLFFVRSDKIDLRPQISVSNNVLEFDSVEVNETIEKSFTIRNDGDSDLNISDIMTNENVFKVNNFSPFNISPKSEEAVVLSFTPEQAKDYNDALTIVSNDPQNDSLILALKGIGYQTEPMLSISNDFLNFGTVYDTSSVQKCVNIGNIGDGTLIINKIKLKDGNVGFSLEETSKDSVTILPSDSNEICLKFNSEILGEHNDELLFNTNDSESKEISIDLSANVIESITSVDEFDKEDYNIRIGKDENNYTVHLNFTKKIGNGTFRIISLEGKELYSQLISGYSNNYSFKLTNEIQPFKLYILMIQLKDKILVKKVVFE